MRWLNSLFRKDPNAPRKRSPVEVATLIAEITANSRAECAKQDRMFDAYYALPNRPTVRAMVCRIEGSEPFEADLMDFDDYAKWQINNRGRFGL